MTIPTPDAKSNPKRRWYQFGLRTLILTVTLAGLVCAATVPAIREWQARQKLMDIQQAMFGCHCR